MREYFDRISSETPVLCLEDTIREDKELEADDAKPIDLSRVSELANRWSRFTQFNNCCGPIESSIANTIQSHQTGQRVSIGKPVPNTLVYVLDDEMKPSPIGEKGSMWVGGAGVSRGYLNLPEKMMERYRRVPFLNDGRMMFNTGDLGQWRDDGQLDHLGRADDQVKVKVNRVVSVGNR